MENSKIAWTNHTFNPWWGCTKVSPGCKNCYAEKFATGRLRMPVWGQDAERKIASESLWRKPLLWNKRAADNGVRERVFCASMADVFEDYQGPDAARVMEARERLWSLIEATTSLDWLLLTKRPQNVMNMVPVRWYERVVPSATPGDHGSPYLGVWAPDRWPANVWIGCTVENQDQARERLPHLLKVPSKVRFVSYEPALEAVDFAKWLWPVHWSWDARYQTLEDALKAGAFAKREPQKLVHANARFIDWLIVGGESGTGARPFNPAWAAQVVEQCKAAQTPVFVKQFGSNPTLRSGSGWGPVTATKGDDMAEWPEQLRVREFPET
jgi:protein gp37